MLERLLSDVKPDFARLLENALAGRELGREDAVTLLNAQGADYQALLLTADAARKHDKGDDVSYVICRNINFTNVCYVGCSFCGFARHRDEPEAYDRTMEQILAKCDDAVARGATEVCIQGGIDPKKDHTHYRLILETIKAKYPRLHIHAYSPEEISFMQQQSGWSFEKLLTWLKEAGLGTIPGTAAEILEDSVRRQLSPNKLMTARWIEIVKTAHRVGLRSTSTIMYGHLEKPHHVATHLGVIRDIQKDTGGFTEFVPLGFIHEKNTLGHVDITRPGPSAAEDLKMIAVARLFLRPHIQNVQMSWVKMGPKLAQVSLTAGANDFGGTLMEESISRESGADFGENLPAEEMRRLIREMGRTPVERSTTYQVLRRFDDPANDPPSLEPEHLRPMAGPARFRGEAGVVRVRERIEAEGRTAP